MVVFKTKVLHFKLENTSIKDVNGKRKFKKKCSVSFLWTNESFLLWKCLSRNSTLFLYGPERLACFQQTKAARLVWRNFRYILYSMVKNSFKKGIFCIYKGFTDVFYILTSVWKKNHNMCPDLNFALWAYLTCMNGSTIQLVLSELLLRINLRGFE